MASESQTPPWIGPEYPKQALAPVVEVVQVVKRFPDGEEPAVNSLSLSLNRGEILCILGPSGCGKTTTLRLIAGFERPGQGEVLIDGKLVAGPKSWSPPEKRSVGMVFQDYALFPHLTVAQNAGFGLTRVSKAERRERIQEVLALVDMVNLGNRYPHQLSGGQQQRVAVARALAPRPVVILLDEPFNNLDADMRTQMRKEVRDILRRESASAILVTHDQEEAFAIADRVAVLRKGCLEQVDTPESIYHQPASPFVAHFVGLANFVSGYVKEGSIETELGSFRPYSNSVEGPVEILIRPEQMHLIPDENARAEIVGREFSGSVMIYTVRLPSDAVVRGLSRSQEVLPIGQKVQILVPDDQVVAFPKEQG